MGAIFSIILFTIAHAPKDLMDYIIYGIWVVIYSIIYYKTQTLEIPIIIHSMNNLLVCLN
ncbi:TPA: CPBP family intramembrane glutamic endopeptidase [Clostridioides difficile]